MNSTPQAAPQQSNARTVIIGIGGNLADPVASIRRAISELKRVSWLVDVRASSLYRSSPLGPVEQPDFINAVLTGTSTAPAAYMLAELQHMERMAGRDDARVRWGPRVLDLDLLMVGDEVVANESLQLPHQEMCNRRFVLGPLLEIEPSWVHPISRVPILDLLSILPEGDVVERLDEEAQ